MTKRHKGGRFGLAGKTVGNILAAAPGVVGVWGWIYLLAVSVQGPGGITDISAPFFTVGLLLWLIFWGGALAIIAGFFGKKSSVTLVALSMTAIMLAAAIITPIAANVL